MWPQIVSSLAAGLALLVAAVMLNSPIAVLILPVCCMFACTQHALREYGYIPSSNLCGIIGLGLSAALWLYLLFLAI